VLKLFLGFFDWNDRTTCVLFGDGAGAVILEAAEGKGDKTDRGILSTHLHSDGAHYNLLYTDADQVPPERQAMCVWKVRKCSRHAVYTPS